jgi:acetyl esterase/lipase
METTKKKFKIMGISLAVIALLIILFLVYFFVYNKAPIISGNFKYDIEYKSNLKLDIYFPTQQVYAKAPVVVYFHGGAWITGRKEVINANRVNGAVNGLREKGYAFVCPDYTLATRETPPFPACIIDAFDVLNWVNENAEKYNFDTENIGVAGESAGAHIAMMVAYTNPEEIDDSVKIKVKINYVVDIYGPSDLEKLYHSQTVEKINSRIDKLPDNLRERLDITQHLFGFDPEKDSAKAKEVIEKYSPVNYLDGNIPPTLIIQGLSDQIVPANQSTTLHQKIDSLGVKNEFYQLEDVGHAFRGITAEQKAKVQDWIVNFIKAHYNP